MDLNSLSQVVIAIGALGTASFGLVDASKLFAGGMSNPGFGFIKAEVHDVLGLTADPPAGSLPESIEATLYANWINGAALTDQKAKAKALLLVGLTPETAGAFAQKHSLEGDIRAVFEQMQAGKSLPSSHQKDLWARFDLILTSMLDQAYQRADQRYRNACKSVATAVAVLIAVAGMYLINDGTVTFTEFYEAVLAGILSGPLAPIAKDLASSLTAGAKVVQSIGA